MFDLEKIRLPYREETAFSLLAFCVFLVPVAFSLFAYENFESIKFSLFLIFTGLSGLIYIFKNKSNIYNIKVNKFAIWTSLLFYLFVLFSTLGAEDKIYSIFGFYYRFTNSFLFYSLLLVFSFLFINIISKDKLNYLFKILVVDALLVSVITYLQGFGWIFYAGLEFGGFFRGPSLLGNPNYSAMFLCCILPICAYLFSISKKFASRLYYLFSGVVILISLLLLASRGAVLALIVTVIFSTGLYLFANFNKKKLALILLLITAFFVLGYYLLNVIRPVGLNNIVQGNDANTQTRLYAWRISYGGIKQHFWLGSGLGNYALFFEKNRTSELPGDIGVFDDAHNLFLQMAVSGGVPLTLLFLTIIVLSFIIGVKQFLHTKDILYISILSSLVAWLVSVMFNPVPIPMFMLLVIILAGLTYDKFDTVEYNLNWVLKYIFILFFAIFVILGLVSIISEHYLGLARNANNNQDFVKSYKLARVSAFINPINPLSLVYLASAGIFLEKPKFEVESIINKNLQIHPTQANTYVKSGNLEYFLYLKYQDQNNLLHAIVNMEKALTIDPLFSERFGQLALYYFQQGDLNKSKFNVLKAISLQKDVFSNWMLLAKIYQTEGNKQETVNSLNEAFKINPNITQLKYLLQMAREASNIKSIPLEITVKRPSI